MIKCKCNQTVIWLEYLYTKNLIKYKWKVLEGNYVHIQVQSEILQYILEANIILYTPLSLFDWFDSYGPAFFCILHPKQVTVSKNISILNVFSELKINCK